MISISNGLFKSIAIDWANITLPLNAGTPVSLAGAVSNDGDAVGLVPQTYKEVPLMPEIYVLVGGDVDLNEIEDTFGDELESAAIKAMDGIRFFADGTPAEGKSGDEPTGNRVIDVAADETTGDLFVSKTAGEIIEAMNNGELVIVSGEMIEGSEVFGLVMNIILQWQEGDDGYTFTTIGGDVLTAATEDDYPVFSADGGGGEVVDGV